MNKEHNKSTTSMLLQSMISIIICCVCLIGSTFAWFASETSAGVESVISSELGFDVSVTQKASGTQVNTESESLLSGNAYIINLSISDTSTATKGYCLITIDDADGSTSYYTSIFEKGVLESKSFEIIVGKECKISVESSWGTHGNETCGDKINHSAYSISYNLDGGIMTIPNPTVYIVGNDEITLNNPTKDGYEFIGWTGSNGDNPETYVVIEPNSVGDKTYFAVWKEAVPNLIINNNQYSITYELSGGCFTETAPEEYGENTESFSLPQPIKEGYNFVGWIGSNGDDPQKDVVIEQNSIGDKIYTAVWIEAEADSPISETQYTITYELNDGTFSESVPETYFTGSESFTLPQPIKDGYEFIGWTGSNGETPETIVVVSSDDSGDKTYFANWAEIIVADPIIEDEEEEELEEKEEEAAVHDVEHIDDTEDAPSDEPIE